MKKTVYLLSNAHLDPVWQWEWEEGAAAALSTFRCAADFCDEFDGYVFNHNEALLYEWVEEYEPELLTLETQDGGELTLENAPDGGTIVTVRLPVTQ